MQIAKKPQVRIRFVRGFQHVCVFVLSISALVHPARARGNNAPPPLITPPIQPEHPAEQPAQAAALADGLTVDPKNRLQVLRFYKQYFVVSSLDPGWSGSSAQCAAGDTSAAYKEAVAQRINYFRAMAGVPANITLSVAYNAKAQQAALMMSANNELNHTPPDSWKCFTEDGKAAARSSNLAMGGHGPEAINMYMLDPSEKNGLLGHRRLLLLPQTQEMGTGDVPTAPPTNALWVLDSHSQDTRPPTREAFVAWPPPGFVPYPVIYPRWSFSLADADFGQATVAMLADGKPISTKLEPVANGFGENTLVWIPLDLKDNALWPKPPAAGTVYSLTVGNVRLGTQTRTFSYEVTAIDPDIPLTNTSATSITLSGPGMIGSTWPANAQVAVFVPNDSAGASGYTYALATGAGDQDNAAFVVERDTLKTKQALTEVGKTYSVRVQAVDPEGVSVSSVFTLPVVKTKDAFLPVLVK